MYIYRLLEDHISRVSGAFPALIVTGPRQVGKTTLLRRLAGADRKYVTLDDPLARETAIRDPAGFVGRYAPPVIIDEIQYAPGILPYIKMYIDEHRRMGDFWFTGSQAFHMMKNVSESLAGRLAVIQMFGLSHAEIEGAASAPFVCDHGVFLKRLEERRPLSVGEVYERIFAGSFPSAYSGEPFMRETFYGSYVNTYLQRDVKDLTQVGDELTFLSFMTACAARTSQMVNYADLAKDVGVSAPTVKRWLSVLMSSGIITLIQPYFTNTLKRAIKAPNMYFMDTGLCAYLTRWDGAGTLEASAMAGAFFETYVVSEILKSYYNAGRRPPVYYYRDTDGREVDLLLDANGTLFPIEIKKTASPKRSGVRHFAALSPGGKPVGEGSLISMYRDVTPLEGGHWTAPVWVV
jgi:predicted AAA+ superfamily ATPase